MSVTIYDCGAVDNTVSAILDNETGIMRIIGSGAIGDYSSGYSPWYSDRADINGVTIAEGITRIGTGTFYNCSNISYVDIPKSVTTIGTDTFNGCTNLKNIKISNRITAVGNNTFKDSGLETVKFYGSAPSYGTDVFDGVICNIYVPEDDESWDNTVKAGMGTNDTTWYTFDAKPVLIEYDELDYFWSKIKKWVNDNKSDNALPIIDDKTFIKYLTSVISDSNHTNTSTTLYVNNPEYFAENDCLYVKKDSTHFFYGIVSAVNNNTGALTYSIPASDGGTFFSPDNGQLVVNYGNPMNGGVYLDWANDRVDLYQNHTELERCYNIYDPIFNINAWNSTTAGIAEEDGVVDVSGNDNHGQAFGGVTVFKDKVMGRCFRFDGVDDYLSFPSMVDKFQNLDGCTFTFKIKINTLPSSSANVFGGIVGESNILSCRVNSSGSIYVTSSGGAKSIAANQLLTTNDIFSVCFVFDYLNSLAKVYINGSLSNEVEWYSSSPTEVFDCFGIGAKVQTNSSAFWLNGEISDFRIFDKVLTSEQVKVIHNQSLVTQYLNANTYSPILNLDADYSTTSSIAVADGVIDVSGNHNNGQAYGGVTVVQDAEIGDCFHFDNNSTSRVVISSIGDTTSNNGYTVSLTIRHGKDTGSSWFICRRSEADNSVLDWQLVYYNGDLLWGVWDENGTGIFPVDSRTPYPAPVIEEKHTYGISVDHDNKTAQFYYDGQPYGDLIELSDYPNMANTQVVIGGPWNSRESSLACLCDISNVRIYPKALSASEVYNVYQQSLNPEALENPEKLLSYNDINVHNFDNDSLVQDTMFRIGNLNGILGITDNIPGVFIGDENEYIKFDKINGLKINGTAEKAEMAQIANMLGVTTIGNSTTPIYLVNGNPTECNISIGGRNIARGTTTMTKGGGTWASGTWRDSGAGTTYNVTISDSPISSLVDKGVTITLTTSSSGGFAQDTVTLADSDITMSCWVKGTAGSSILLQPFYSSSLGSYNKSFTLNGEWQYLYCTGKVRTVGTYSIGYCYLKTSNSTVSIIGIKVEYGTMPSTWTPAPEDTVSHATLANTVIGSYTSNGGKQNPNYFGKNRVGFLMMNTTVNSNTQYKDWILMDCYNGTDVGGGVAFGVNRQALGAYIMRSAAARESWAESAELIGTHNYTSYTVKKDGTGASGSWGISVTGSSASCTGNAASSTYTSNIRVTSTKNNNYYYIVGTSGNTASTNYAPAVFPNIVIRDDTDSTSEAFSRLKLGNSTAKGTSGGKTGCLSLYGNNTRICNLLGPEGASADCNVRLPNSAGTLALTSSNITGSSASCTGNAATATTASACSGNSATATTATNANNVKTTVGSGAWYDVTGVATGFTSGSNYASYGHNSGAISFYVDANATSGNQRGILRLGNATANTTAAGHNGELWLYGTSTTYLAIKSNPAANKAITIKTTGTTAREYTLPDKAGTFAMTSDIVRNFPADGSSATTVQNLTNTNTVSNTTASVMLVMVYCYTNEVNATLKNGSTTLMNAMPIHRRGADGSGRYPGGSTTTFLLLKNDVLTLSANADNIHTRVIVA